MVQLIHSTAVDHLQVSAATTVAARISAHVLAAAAAVLVDTCSTYRPSSAQRAPFRRTSSMEPCSALTPYSVRARDGILSLTHRWVSTLITHQHFARKNPRKKISSLHALHKIYSVMHPFPAWALSTPFAVLTINISILIVSLPSDNVLHESQR